MTAPIQRYAIRDRFGAREVVFIETRKGGFWRGYRVADGIATRGRLDCLISAHDDEAAAKAALRETGA